MTWGTAGKGKYNLDWRAPVHPCRASYRLRRTSRVKDHPRALDPLATPPPRRTAEDALALHRCPTSHRPQDPTHTLLPQKYYPSASRPRVAHDPRRPSHPPLGRTSLYLLPRDLVGKGGTSWGRGPEPTPRARAEGIWPPDPSTTRSQRPPTQSALTTAPCAPPRSWSESPQLSPLADN